VWTEEKDYPEAFEVFGKISTAKEERKLRLKEAKANGVSLKVHIAKKITEKESIPNEIKEAIDYYTDYPDLKEAIEAYLEMRSNMPPKDRIKTKQAVTLLLNKLSKYGKTKEEQIEMLELATLSAWKSVYPLKEQNTTPTRSGNVSKKRLEPVPEWFGKEEIKPSMVEDKEARARFDEIRRQHGIGGN